MADKLTDAEIIKALECCKHGHGKCTSCPLYPKVANGCQNILIQGVLDLTNRRNEMIDALIAGQETLQKAIAERDAEIKHLESASLIFKGGVEYFQRKAIKEFAERLKNEIISDSAYGCDCNQHNGYYDYTIKFGDILEYIDNLVKEMEGE